MSFRSTITVEFGDKNGVVDISDRVQGAQVTTELRVGDMGNNRARITFRNDDGAFTPGGGGTYSTVDWFSKALFIEGDTGSYTYNVFHGMVTDYTIIDDGVNSIIQMQADDGMTVGGASATVFDLNGLNAQFEDWIKYVYNGTFPYPVPLPVGTINGAPLPLLANTTSSAVFTDVGIGDTIINRQLHIDEFRTTEPARDFVRKNLMAAGPNYAWPTTIDVSTTDTKYNSTILSLYAARSSSTAITFTFSEGATSGELPFSNIQRGFDSDSILNTAVIETISPHAGATSTNSDSVNKYGGRAFQATELITGNPATTNGTSSAVIADRWANIFSSSEYSVRSFTVNESQVRSAVGGSATSEQKWAQLLDVSTGPMQHGEIVFNPAGTSTTITEDFVVMSRTIEMTPGDIRLSVESMPIAETGVFVLDSSTLGVLDTNRLG